MINYNKFLQRLFLAIVCIGLLALPPTKVYADATYESNTNEYYAKHKTECEAVDSTFEANGPAGEVKVYISPEAKATVGTIKNKEKFNVYWKFHDDFNRDWCLVVYYNQDSTELTVGWVPYEFLFECYNEQMFESDYEKDIKEQAGKVEHTDSKLVCLFTYPGSLTYRELVFDKEDEIAYSKIYIDEDKREWGLCEEYSGIKNGWICIKEPDATVKKLYPEGIPKRDFREKVDNSEASQILPQLSHRATIVMWATVLVFVFLVALIIYGVLIFRKYRVKKAIDKQADGV